MTVPNMAMGIILIAEKRRIWKIYLEKERGYGHIEDVIEEPLANEPCRQVRGRSPLTVAAFAVCKRPVIHPDESKLSPAA